MVKKIHFKVPAMDFLTVKMLIAAIMRVTTIIIAAIMTKKMQIVIITSLITNSLAAIAITKVILVLPTLQMGQP